MTDVYRKLHQLDSLADLQPDDLLLLTHDPSGDPHSVKMSVADFLQQAYVVQNPDKNFTFPFNVSSSVTVTHNLGKYPAVTVIDSAGDEVEGEVDHQTVNQLIVSFSAAFSGKVIVN